MKNLTQIWDHLKKFREVYAHLPLAFIFLFAFAIVIHLLTGRAPEDNLVDFMGMGENFIKIILAVVATGFVKGHILTDLTDEETKSLPLGRVILDSVETLVLLCLFVFALFWR